MDLRAFLKALKFGMMLRPQLKDDGDFANNVAFDCAGIDAVLIAIAMGTTDIAVGSTAETTPPYLEECDTDSVTAGDWTKITGSDLSAVIPDDADGKFYGWFIDRTKTRKRFVRINVPHSGNGSAGANAAAIALGFPSQKLPTSAAEMGFAELVEI